MNAAEAKEKTIKANLLANNESERLWATARDHIFTMIRNSAERGKSECILDLKYEELAPVANKNYQRIETELTNLGYKVTTVFERSLNGARRMTVSW